MTKDEQLALIIDIVLSRIFDDVKDILDNPNHDLLNDGQRLAFAKVFTAFQDAIQIADAELSDYGLDFDIDKIL